MNKHAYLVIPAAVVLASGCTHVPVRRYSGIVQRVEIGDFTGYTVSPVAASASPVVRPAHLYVSIGNAAVRQPRIVRIDFLDSADRAALGQVGRRVKFDLRGDLPVDDHISSEALARYSVEGSR